MSFLFLNDNNNKSDIATFQSALMRVNVKTFNLKKNLNNRLHKFHIKFLFRKF